MAPSLPGYYGVSRQFLSLSVKRYSSGDPHRGVEMKIKSEDKVPKFQRFESILLASIHVCLCWPLLILVYTVVHIEWRNP